MVNIFNIPFKILSQIKQIMHQYPVDDLILILTSQNGDQLLSVHFNDKLPEYNSSILEVKTLSKLRDEDWITYSGLSVTYEALSLIFPFLQPCGPYFYSITQLFKELGKPNLQNSVNLARWLWDQNIEFRQNEKIVSLLLPFWIQENPPESRAVGLVISLENFSKYLERKATPTWLTVEDISNWDGGKKWLLTFREIKLLFPSEVLVTDWRKVLNQGGFKNLYRKGLFALAQALWEKGKDQNQSNLKYDAWKLAIEYWASNWISNDVLAIQPKGNFEDFLKEGNTIVLGRSPVLPVDKFSRISWNEISKYKESIWFALQPLIKHLTEEGATKVIALEPIWEQSGRLASLSQSLLGLVEDVREGELRHRLKFPAQDLVWLALQGLWLIALSDPWEPYWGGRYGIALQKAYNLLDDVFVVAKSQINKTEQPMFELLHEWYITGIKPQDDFERHWDNIRNLSAALTTEESNNNIQLLQKLINLLDDPVQNIYWQEIDELSIEYLQNKLQLFLPPFVSNQFVSMVKEWSDIHRKIWEAEQQFERPKLENIEHWLQKLSLLSRCSCCLPHEKIILHHFTDKDIDTLKRLRAALKGQVVLLVRLLTDPLLINQWTDLTIGIRNIGERDARNLKVKLGCTNREALRLNENLTRDISQLPARSEEYRLSWRVSITSPNVGFDLTCEYEDEEERKKYNEKFPLNIHFIRRAGRGVAPKGGNLFQAGIAVSGDKFYGRRDVLNQIFDFLLADTNQPILLRGPRRIGKTSVLFQIAYLLEKEGRLQKFLKFTKEDEAKIRRYRPIQITLQEIQKEEDIPSWFFKLYNRMAKAVGLSVDKSLLEEFRNDAFQGFESSLRDILLKHTSGVHWLILLDEWDEQHHIQGLGGKMRALMQNRDLSRLFWIFASSWMLSEEAGHFGSPFYSQCKNIELTAMHWNDARQMVVEISEKMGVKWEGAALLKLLDQTALRPYLIQHVGQDVIKELKKVPSNFVDLEILNKVLHEIVNAHRDPTSPFSFLWPDKMPSENQKASLSWLGRMVLLVLDKVNRPLSSLEIQEYIENQFSKRGWRFPINKLFDDLIENLTKLERIFDVVKVVKRKYDFSIPLGHAWFHNKIEGLDDPWNIAWEGLMKEYKDQSTIEDGNT